nr:protein kinase [uncultured Allomuricauda sp.]
MPIDIKSLPEDQISAVHDLTGKELKTGWTVTKRVEPKPGSSGGGFSVCYLATKNGEEGFLKAINVLSFLNDDDIDFTKAMADTLNTFNFEKTILEKCGNQNLSKVSRLLDAGSENMTGYIINNVNYLVFEKADDDVRNFINFSDKIDFAWKLRSLHNIAVGIRQLHSLKISHQDLKPSNVFVFNKEVSKIGDLGRALSDSIIGPHSHRNFAGDARYAPPEVFHMYVLPEWQDKVFAIDCYLLGSMACFYITGQSMTALLVRVAFAKNNLLTLKFDEALPYWIEAYDEVLERVNDVLDDYEDKEKLIESIRMLCQPDPKNRGHFKNAGSRRNIYNMERFVAIFNLLASKAEMKIRK